MDKLQHVQNAAAHLVTGNGKSECDAWQLALAGYSPASAVQACCNSPSLSSEPSYGTSRTIVY